MESNSAAEGPPRADTAAKGTHRKGHEKGVCGTVCVLHLPNLRRKEKVKLVIAIANSTGVGGHLAELIERLLKTKGGRQGVKDPPQAMVNTASLMVYERLTNRQLSADPSHPAHHRVPQGVKLLGRQTLLEAHGGLIVAS